MPQFSVVTDSTASIPEPMLEELNVHTVAYYIHRGGRCCATWSPFSVTISCAG